MDIIFLPHFKAIKRKPAAIPGASRNFKTMNYKNEYCHTWPKKKKSIVTHFCRIMTVLLH